MKILFLDIDGVLNCNTTKERFGPYVGIDMSLVKNLKRIIEETDCKIVLSSTWRLEDDSTEAVHEAVGHDHFVGKTTSMGRYNTRPEEVSMWIGDNQERLNIETYCILDDDFEFYDDQKHFKTGWISGLDADIADQVIDYLNGQNV